MLEYSEEPIPNTLLKDLETLGGYLDSEHRLMENLCSGDPIKEAEAERAAVSTLGARLALWDAVAHNLELRQQNRQLHMGYPATVLD